MAAPISESLISLLRCYCKSFRCYPIRTHCRRYCTNSLSKTGREQPRARDPLPIFLKDEVQRLLYRINSFDISKICAPQKVPSRKPHYELLTDTQLQKKQEEAVERAQTRLQMPPVMRVREEVNPVLSQDPELAGLMDAKLVCVDITYGISDRKRHVVVRDLDGTLRHGTGEERDRINQIYNPKPGRQMFTPRIFEPENLEAVLDKGWYAYVLDWACLQFEPDQPEYIRVTQRTYEHVGENKKFDDLRSTRHFGPMAFYFAWHKSLEPLLMDMVQRDLLSDGSDLVHLFTIIHPDSETCQRIRGVDDDLQTIKIFCETETSHSYKGQLQLTIQAYEDAQNLHVDAA
ncbi:hypothetical protein ScPMuIL_007740 [Solemya velum]